MFGGRPGPLELIIIFAVILLIIGPSKLPRVGQAFGKAIGEFKFASKGEKASTEGDDS
ncbi:MAG: twin-arginine translocase TatA/TatE family subunit [Firmicutes bacterium]|nr:twin-arginine translocase TatA/TatE family subunit [Bacillota bacterium]